MRIASLKIDRHHQGAEQKSVLIILVPARANYKVVHNVIKALYQIWPN